MNMVHRPERCIKKGSFSTGDSVLIDYFYVGNSKPSTVAFVNGWGTTTLSEWSRQMRIREHNLLFFNNRGNGESGFGGTDYLGSCASDLRELLMHLGIESVSVVGHSMGGLIATKFFNEYRDGIDVKAMIFVSSPHGNPLETFPYRMILPENLARIMDWYSEGFLSGLADVIERRPIFERAAYIIIRGTGLSMSVQEFSSLYHNFLSRRKANMVALRAMVDEGHRVGLDMAKINVPTLIVHAKGDFLVSPEAAHKIHDRISGSVLHMFERSTHAPMFEQHAEFNRVLLGFLSEHNEEVGSKVNGVH